MSCSMIWRDDLMTLTCDKCGKEFEPGTRDDGLPNGVEFKLSDGSSMVVCTDCIIEEGKNQ